MPTVDDMSTQTLSRPLDDRMIGGVCAGIARRFGWRTSTVRILTAASILIPGPQVLAYLIAWAVIPGERRTQAV